MYKYLIALYNCFEDINEILIFDANDELDCIKKLVISKDYDLSTIENASYEDIYNTLRDGELVVSKPYKL